MIALRAVLLALLFGTFPSYGQTVWVEVVDNDFSSELELCTVSPIVGGWFCPGAVNWLLDGEPTWGIVEFMGDRRLWCMGGTSADPTSSSYVPGMNAVASYGPIDLTDATDVEISFDYYLDKQAFSGGQGDLVEVGMAESLHGNVWRRFEEASTTGWRSVKWSVNRSTSEAAVLGRSETWFVLRFTSDASNEPGAGILIDNLKVKKQVPLLAENLYFPQFGNGQVGGVWLASQLDLMNTGEQTVTFAVEARDSQGVPMPVPLNGLLNNGRFEGTIQPGGTAVVETDGRGPLMAGSVTVRSDKRLAGYVLFSGSVGEAAVTAAEPGKRFMVPIEPGEGVRVGLALMGLEFDSAVALSLRDRSGVWVSSAQLDLKALRQKAQFLDELAWAPPLDITQISGSLTVEATEPIGALLLRQGIGKISTLPVVKLN